MVYAGTAGAVVELKSGLYSAYRLWPHPIEPFHAPWRRARPFGPGDSILSA
jgi:hypothetical protein